jgi:glycosyltransferase involved in cell wall biosynthesis
MNVLFLIHRYPPAVGGSERFVQALARRLVAEGHQATVYTSNLLDVEGFWLRGRERLATGMEDDSGVSVRRFEAVVLPLHSATSQVLSLVPWAPLGLTMLPPGLVLPDLWRAVRAGGEFDVIHASAYPSLMYLGNVAARRSGAKSVLMPCTHPRGDGDGTRRRYFVSKRVLNLYHQAEAIIALTEHERQVMKRAGVPGDRLHVTGAGVDPASALGADGMRFRQQYELASDTPIVSFVGHKTAGKGALYLLDACEVLLAQRPGLVFALVGAGTEEFSRRYRTLPDGVRRRVLNLSLSEQEKHDLLAASSVLALPSRDDSFGIVLLEAWLHGKPVIGARAGGIPDVIDEGQTGLLVSYGDVSALSKAISWLLDHPEEAEQMGSQGREMTLQRWTWDAVYKKVRAVYKQILTR